MPRILAPLAVVTALVSLVNAGIQFQKPAAGAKLTAGSAIEVTWKDGGDGPALTDLTTYELFLCAGGNDPDEIIVLLPITTAGAFSAGNSAQGMVGKTVGANTPSNAYFVKIVGTAKTGGTLTVYSDRFSYSGMTGTFPDSVVTAMKSVSGTDGPKSQDQTTGDDAAAANPDAGEFAVEYTMQTGATRYAPMQPLPPTKISKKSASAQYPTSAVDIARKVMPTPKIQTTITQSRTHSVESKVNTVAAQPHATDDMAKFLNRWKD